MWNASQICKSSLPRDLYCSSFRICAADISTTKCLLFNLFFFFFKAWILIPEGVWLWKQAACFRSPEGDEHNTHLKRGTISLMSFSFFTSSSRTGAHNVPIMPIMNSASLEMSRAPFSASCFIRSRSKTSVIWILSLVWPGSKKDRRVYKRAQPR